MTLDGVLYKPRRVMETAEAAIRFGFEAQV